MNNYEPSAPPYPEHKPDIALISLYSFYRAEPEQVRRDQIMRLQALIAASSVSIDIHQRAHREDDEDLPERIDYHRDRILTLMAHESIARASFLPIRPVWEAPSLY